MRVLIYTCRRPTSALNQKPIANGDIPQREDTEYPGSGFGSLPNKRLLFPSGELILRLSANPITDVYLCCRYDRARLENPRGKHFPFPLFFTLFFNNFFYRTYL